MEKSCGTIPYTVVGGQIRYLLIRSGRGCYYGFPKGHVEQGESEVETAYRETLEETSLRVDVDASFRHEILYKMSNGRRKTVVYFLGRFQNQTARRYQNFESFTYELLSFSRALEALSFDSSRQMLRMAHAHLLSHGVIAPDVPK